nr:MAG TPA: hypothetical protein [Caudoviricetes sp.]
MIIKLPFVSGRLNNLCFLVLFSNLRTSFEIYINFLIVTCI